MKKKTMALVLALTMVIGCAIGGTIAYLQANSGTVKNTFTVGKIGISIEEKDADHNEAAGTWSKTYKMVPNTTLEKKATVTVNANSVTCYLFIKVTPSFEGITVDGTKYGISDFLDYSVKTTATDGSYTWTQLTNADGTAVENVYYMTVNQSDGAQAFDILTDNQVKVRDTVTKEMMDAAQKIAAPTLSFKAAAIQIGDQDGAFEPYEAYEKVAGFLG